MESLRLKLIFAGVGLQFLIAYLILNVDTVRYGFKKVSLAVGCLKEATLAGTSFVFGFLGGGTAPFAFAEGKGIGDTFIFAFQPLPMIMVISALSMLLFHWRILPVLVKMFSWGLRKTLNIGGALGLCAAVKVFLGQTEAPLVVRPYLSKFSRSELFTVMTAGMATTSATIILLYAHFLKDTISDPISHILTASIISIPAAITISRVLIPHEGEHTSGDMVMPYKFTGSMDAVSQGATDGIKLFLNIIAMLVVMIALVALFNMVLALFPSFRGSPVTLQGILGYVFAPVTWMMGIPWSEATTAGNLLGTKTILNEVIAFINLSKLSKGILSDHSNIIMTYALCGFANLSSIGIQIGGLGAMVPERRTEIISLSAKALMAGTIASCMSGTVVGLLWWLK